MSENVDNRIIEFLDNNKNSHIFQTPWWMEFKQEWEGGYVTYEEDGKIVALAMILLRKLPFFGNLAYIGRGPIYTLDENGNIPKEQVLKLNEKIIEFCKKNNVFRLQVEPFIPNTDKEYIDLMKESGFREMTETEVKNEEINSHLQVITRINTDSPEDLLMSFSQKTRYNIRLADKKGVELEFGTINDFDEFERIQKITGLRDKIITRDKEYFERMFKTLPEHTRKVVFAKHDGDYLGAVFLTMYGSTVDYLYGGSTNVKRNFMPNYKLQWYGLKYAVEHGFANYNFGGIKSMEDSLLQFKRGFNSEIVTLAYFVKAFKPFKFALYQFVYNFRKKVLLRLKFKLGKLKAKLTKKDK